MPISELNSFLLQLLRDYKQAILYREVYKALLAQSAPALPQPKIQAALDAFQPLLDRKFLQAEKQLEGGIDPRKVLDDFLHPLP